MTDAMDEEKVDNPVSDGDVAAGDGVTSSGTGIFLGGKLDLPMTMHQAAVKFCMAEDVGGATKAIWLALMFMLTLLELGMFSCIFWDRGCITHDQCKQGVSACWDLGDRGFKQCHYCHDFYIDRTCKPVDDDDAEPGRCSDADTEALWDHIQWKATVRGDAPPWEDAPPDIPIVHKYAGQNLPTHVNNASFSCAADDELCQQCFNADARKFGRLGDTDVATDIMRAMRTNDWLMLLSFALFSACMASTMISDIATQVMLMNRALKNGVPGVMPFIILGNWLVAARHMILGNMFGMFNVFARVHHDSGHAKDQATFALTCFLVLNFSRFVYAYGVPPHIRKVLQDKEPEYEATQAEVDTLSRIRLLYILFLTEAPWVSLYAVRDGMNPAPPMHLMLSFLVFIGLGALYPADSTADMAKNVGLQFIRFIVGFISFGITDSMLQ